MQFLGHKFRSRLQANIVSTLIPKAMIYSETDTDVHTHMRFCLYCGVCLHSGAINSWLHMDICTDPN